MQIAPEPAAFGETSNAPIPEQLSMKGGLAPIPAQVSMEGGGDNFPALSGPNLFVKKMQRKPCDCKAKTEYLISTMEDRQNDFLYGLSKNREINVTTSARAGGAPVAKFEHPLRFPMHQMKCCCYQEVHSTTPQGQPNGSVREKMYFVVPEFEVINESGAVEYRISSPTCLGGMCMDICAEGFCSMLKNPRPNQNCGIPLYIFPPTGGNTKKENIGSIRRNWSNGWAARLRADPDTLEVQFPTDANTNAKARLLGAVFFLNQIFFDQGL